LPVTLPDGRGSKDSQVPRLTVQRIIQQHGSEYLRSHPDLSAPKAGVLKELAACRTGAFGLHVQECAACGYQESHLEDMQIRNQEPRRGRSPGTETVGRRGILEPILTACPPAGPDPDSLFRIVVHPQRGQARTLPSTPAPLQWHHTGIRRSRTVTHTHTTRTRRVRRHTSRQTPNVSQLSQELFRHDLRDPDFQVACPPRPAVDSRTAAVRDAEGHVVTRPSPPPANKLPPPTERLRLERLARLRETVSQATAGSPCTPSQKSSLPRPAATGNILTNLPSPLLANRVAHWQHVAD